MKPQPNLRYTHPSLAPTKLPHLFPLLKSEEEMAKKKKVIKDAKASRTANKKAAGTKAAKKKNTPAAGQKNLPGVESDRDLDLDRALERIAKCKASHKVAGEKYSIAVDAAGELLHKKKRNSYTAAGLVVAVSSQDKVSVTKAPKK